MAMESPDYLICLDCETPCYAFDWQSGELVEAFCSTCGADDVDTFMTEDDLEAMLASSDHG